VSEGKIIQPPTTILGQAESEIIYMLHIFSTTAINPSHFNGVHASLVYPPTFQGKSAFVIGIVRSTLPVVALEDPDV
jgi:hypothetical protein